MRQAGQWLRRGWGSGTLAERWCQGGVHRRVCVGTPVAGNTMLGAVLTVLPGQLLLEKQINTNISYMKRAVITSEQEGVD